MLYASSMKSLLANNLSSRPCLCLDSMSSGSFNVKGNIASYLYEDIAKRRQFKKRESVNLSTPFVDAWYGRRHLSLKISSHMARGRSRKRRRPWAQRLTIVGEVGGQYEDTFIDVKKVSQVSWFTQLCITEINFLPGDVDLSFFVVFDKIISVTAGTEIWPLKSSNVDILNGYIVRPTKSTIDIS